MRFVPYDEFGMSYSDEFLQNFHIRQVYIMWTFFIFIMCPYDEYFPRYTPWLSSCFKKNYFECISKKVIVYWGKNTCFWIITNFLQGTGNKEKIEIKNDANRLSPEEVERMIKDAEDFAEEDKKVAERAVAKVNTWIAV